MPLVFTAARHTEFDERGFGHVRYDDVHPAVAALTGFNARWCWRESGWCLSRHCFFFFVSLGLSRQRLWVLLDGVSVVSGSLRIVLLVAVQLVRVVGRHVGEILENVLVGFISCKKNNETIHKQQQRQQKSQAQQWLPIFGIFFSSLNTTVF